MLTIFLLVVDGCTISKVFDTKEISSIIISFKYDSAILICISFGLTLVLYYHLIL